MTARQLSGVEAEDARRESRLRRLARRQGLALVKSRTRNERASSYGCFMVVDPATNIIEAGGQLGPSMTLDDVESYLEEEDL